MKIYKGNISHIINCDLLIETITQYNVEPMHGHMELDESNIYYTEYQKQTNILKNAGYDDKSVEYRHYTSGKHFDKEIENKIADYVGCKPIMCWISEIRPGKCTPWHYDINPWEQEHMKLGKLVRYISFISKPSPGHVFVTETDSYYNEQQGNIYQYQSIHEYHAGANIGLIPKFILTLTGYQ